MWEVETLLTLPDPLVTLGDGRDMGGRLVGLALDGMTTLLPPDLLDEVLRVGGLFAAVPVDEAAFGGRTTLLSLDLLEVVLWVGALFVAAPVDELALGGRTTFRCLEDVAEGFDASPFVS